MQIIKKDRLAIWASKLLAKAQARLHVSPEALITLKFEFIDSFGTPYKRIEGKSHSVLRNYHSICAVTAQMIPIVAPYTSGYGIDGNWELNSTTPTLYYSVPFSSVGTANIGTAGDATLGVQVGTGVAAYHFYNNYKLSTLCTNGTGADNVVYDAQRKVCTWDGGAKTWTTEIARKISNGSGADIDINEIGLVENVYTTAAGGVAKIMMIRDDVSASPITLPNNSGLLITYGFTYQFP